MFLHTKYIYFVSFSNDTENEGDIEGNIIKRIEIENLPNIIDKDLKTGSLFKILNSIDEDNELELLNMMGLHRSQNIGDAHKDR